MPYLHMRSSQPFGMILINSEGPANTNACVVWSPQKTLRELRSETDRAWQHNNPCLLVRPIRLMRKTGIGIYLRAGEFEFFGGRVFDNCIWAKAGLLCHVYGTTLSFL